jgi:hypothetical protein
VDEKSMLALDYFLYDNRTWTSGIGRDWGVKTATGALAVRDDLRAMFERYCGRVCGDRGYLSGFNHALGGMRSLSDNGYLLCVSVETPDSFGRPAWAVYGLWCVDPKVLEQTLAADVVAAVQSALAMPSPPPSIALRSALALPDPVHLIVRPPVFRRFDRSSIAEARALLLGAIREKRELPAILGVTASSRPDSTGEGFSVIYCYPLKDRAQEAFEQLTSSDVDPVVPLPRSAPPISPAAQRRSRRSRRKLWMLGAGIALIATAGAALWKTGSVQRLGARHAVATQLAAIRALNPQDLRILARRRNDHNVAAACKELTRHWERVARTSPGTSHEWLLNEQSDASRPCRVLQLAYPADFRNSRSAARRWCDSLANLERTVNALRRSESLRTNEQPPRSTTTSGRSTPS